MFRKCGIVLLTLVLTGALAACGGTNNVGADLTPDRSTNGFALNVWEESYIDGGKATGYNLEVEDYGEDVVVEVTVEGAQGLKAMYFDMEYDPAAFTPSGVRPMGALVEVDDLIQLTYLAERGKVYHGQVAPNYEWRAGLTGDAVVARVMFRKGGAPQVRTVSAAPSSAQSQTTCTLNGGDPNFVDWYNFNQGDYDQNGEVNIADLSPIGGNFGVTGAQDDIALAVSVVDGDRNGEVNIADLTPIGANFFNTALGGWNVYLAAAEGDIPAAAGDGNGANALQGNIAFNTATGVPSADRLTFTFDATGLAPGWIYVRADDGAGAEGIPSIGVELGGSPVSDIVLTLVNAPGTGDGSPGSPFEVDDATVWEFSVVDNGNGGVDVSLDPLTDWSTAVSDPGAGAIDTSGAAPVLDITDSYTGTFNVQATYDGVDSNRVYMTIPPPETGIFIQPDAADPEWAAIPGTGTSGDPYILESTPPHDEEYDMEAFEGSDNSGAPLDETTLNWHADPEFLLTWPVGGTFIPNQFTNTPLHAEDGTFQSNLVYVVIQGLPT